MHAKEIEKLKSLHAKKGLRLDTDSGFQGTIYGEDGRARTPVDNIIAALEETLVKDTRIAELEAALREMVYFDESTVTWRCGQHGDHDMTDIVGHVLTVKK